MNAKKIKTVLLAVILLAGSFFIASAENNSTRYIIKTQYFDVIYKAPSKKTANLIADNIDRIYLDIRKSLNVEDYYYFKHFPVYIEYSTEELNAYFTDYPFRHVVLYDTVAQDSLSVYETNILSVMQHELVHAVSMNVKNDFNKVLSDIIYNGWGFVFYSMPSSISEGIAVQKESEDGLGRLNDPYSTHIIKQAKIENRFPAFQNITGSRDIYPSGNLPYIFGGAFTDYVIKKYGKEKYSAFLYELNNKLLNYQYSYKKVFGSSFKSDYEEFQTSVTVPDVTVNPYDTDGIEDFYSLINGEEKWNQKYFQKNKSRVTKTASFISPEESGSAWLCSESGDVWYSSRISSRNGNFPSKPVKLFTMSGVTKLSFSSDGKYLAVSRTVSYESRTNVVVIYDMTKRRFYKLGESLRDAAVLSKDGKYYAACVKTVSQDSSIEIYEMSSDGKFSHCKTIECKTGDIPSSLNDAGSLTLSFLYKEGVNRSISLYNKELDRVDSVPVPQGLYIRDLSPVISKDFVTGQKGIVLSFSYARKDTLPRLGFLSVRYDDDTYSSAKLHLQTNDVSGGVYSPSVYFSSQSVRLPSVIFVSQFFDNSKLSVMDTDMFEFEQLSVSVNKDERFDNAKTDADEIFDDQPLKKFNSFEYAFKGIFVPVGLVPLYDRNFNLKNVGFAGLTWHTKNFHVSAGYDPFSQCWGLSSALFNSSPSNNFSFLLVGNVAFDSEGFRQTEDELTMKLKIPVMTHSNVILSSVTKFFTGYPNEWAKTFPYLTTQNHDASYTTFVTQQSAQLSTLHKTGAGAHEVGGVYGGLVLNYTLLDSTVKNYKGQGFNLGLMGGFRLPRMLPFENPENLTLNLPLTVTARLFPNIEKFVSCTASVVLFSLEVQKGTENFFFPLYLNRLYFTAGYAGDLYYSKKINMAAFNYDRLVNALNNSVYTDYVSLGFVMEFTLNTGYLRQIGVLNVGADLYYEINKKVPDNNRIHLKLCSQLVF